MYMQLSKREADLDRFFQSCKEHGYKITPQRRAIFEHIVKAKDHPTAEKVYALIREDYPNMSLDTVYRTLLTFAEIGLMHIVEEFGGPRRFDPNLKSHHHVHCIKCGKIHDFYNDAYDELNVPQEISRKFDVINKRVVLNGVCKKCSSRK